MTELKPCPFCNGRAELKHYIIKGYEPDRMYYVECSKCGQTVVKGKFDTTYHSNKWAINKAIKAWNNRPSPWHTEPPTEEGDYVVLCSTDGEYMVRHLVANLRPEIFHKFFKAWWGEKITPFEAGKEKI